MSEFSDSYHLRTNNPLEAVELIRTTERTGAVLPPQGNWTTFLIEGPTSAPLADLVENNTGLLLHYIHADDHGCWLRFFIGPKELTEASCCWEDPNEKANLLQEMESLEAMRQAGYPIDEDALVPTDGSLARDLSLDFAPHLLVDHGFCDQETSIVLYDLCDRPQYPDLENRYPIAKALGLPFHKWLSCTDLTHLSWDEWRSAYPGLILVDKPQQS